MQVLLQVKKSCFVPLKSDVKKSYNVFQVERNPYVSSISTPGIYSAPSRWPFSADCLHQLDILLRIPNRLNYFQLPNRTMDW